MSGTNVTIDTLPVPLTIGPQGAVQRSPADIRSDLLQLVAADNPGYTVLPAGLIEDLSSTAIGGIQMIDQAFVTFINSIAPSTANAYILALLGAIYGPIQGQVTNTSVDVQFSSPDLGFAIGTGFVISDGTNQYALAEGAIIGSSGTSDIVTAIAVQSGSWAVPAGSVNQLVTAISPSITVTVTNPQAGIPAGPAETVPAFRARVLEAAQAIATGVTTTVKTALKDVPGVVARLVSMRQTPGGKWEIICGGGDAYQVANAIFLAIGGDLPNLVGSTITVQSITLANPGIVTTDLNHGFVNGEIATINGATGMTVINGVPLTVTVITPTSFSIGIDTSSYAPYTGNGVLTPNNRNAVIAVYDYPDTYQVPFVIPPLQTVTMTVTWNTSDAQFTSDPAVALAANPAIVAYINAINAGQPINVFALDRIFLESLTGVIDSTLITRLVFAISVNGIGVSPTSGTGIIPGDPESYFEIMSSGIVISRG